MLKQNLFVLSFAIFALCLISQVSAKLKDGECEVCIKFLEKFEKTLTDADRKMEVLTTKLKAVCNKAINQENRFCYYVGGTKDAATYILNSITKPMSFYKPIVGICEALKKKDSQICDLQYPKELDWANINLRKMRVKELKKILGNWGEGCSGCLEKSDYINKIEEVKNKHIEL